MLELLIWELFEKHLSGKNPSILNMGGNRGVQIGYNPSTQKMFVRIPMDAKTSIPPSPYNELTVDVYESESTIALEVSTKAQHLFREFHRFAGIVTEAFEVPGQTALGAFENAIHRWLELTSRKELLSKEQQLGLQGELTFLHALIKVHGPKAIYAWTGRNILLPERHDFRVGKTDIEIKSTRNLRRQHIIHGLEQLQSSEGHNLYLLSLKFEGAGLTGGKSLYNEVEDVRSLLEKDSTEHIEFENRIHSSGYKNDDAPHYQERFIFAESPMLVLVDDQFPRIVKNMLEMALPSERVGRITDVSYRIDIDGLGFPQGSHQFTDILGELHLEIE